MLEFYYKFAGNGGGGAIGERKRQKENELFFLPFFAAALQGWQ
jgi:hypothetical protein